MKVKKKIASLILSFVLIVLSFPISNIFAKTLKATEVTEEYIGEMPEALKDFAVEVYKDKAFVLGGISTEDGYEQELVMKMYDLNTKKWTTLGEIPSTSPSNFFSEMITTLYKSDIYVLSSESYSRFEILKYNIEKQEWSKETSSNILRPFNLEESSMTIYNDILYIISDEKDLILKYDLSTKIWSSIPSTPLKNITNGKIIVYDNKFYHFGSFSYSGENGFKVGIFDLNTEIWSLTSSMNSWVNNKLALRYDNYFYMIYLGGDYSSVYKYNIKEDTWEEIDVSFKRDTIGREGSFIKDGYIA